MASVEDFNAAVERANALPTQPNNIQLKLYGLFKQATKGDVQGKRPGMMDVRGRAKHDAWATHKGTSPEHARASYIAFVDTLG